MKSTTFILNAIMFIGVCHQLSGQQNVCIDSVDAPEEVSLAICHSDISKMVAGANITCYYYSGDTGRTWKNGFMHSQYGVWGDPTLVSDTGCSFYYFHLSTPMEGHWLDRMVCQKSTDGGQSWSDSSFVGLNGEKHQDKPGVAVDLNPPGGSPYSNRIYLSWTQFDKYGSYKGKDSSRILFSYTADGGKSWKSPVRIDHHAGDCHDNDSTVEGAVPCVGPKGEVYDSWAGPDGIVFNKSLDGGDTWLPNTIKVTRVIGGWSYDISGIDRCDGLPVTLCDISHSPYRGTIYINFSDQRDGTDNTNVWLTKSTDGGNSWSKPVSVVSGQWAVGSRQSSVVSCQHFMSWMTIDQTTGFLYCIYYDRSENGGDTTNVFMAVSKDGGNSFSNFRINERSFVPNSFDFFGDYIDVKAINNVVRPIWMQLNNHRLSIWTDLINPGDLEFSYQWSIVSGQSLLTTDHCQLTTEVAHDNSSIWLTFRLREDEKVNLSVIDIWGRQVRQIYTGELMEKGDKEYILNLAKEKLTPGSYAYKLEIAGLIRYKKFVVY